MAHYYKFVVYPGNNSFVIRDALLKRGNWKEIQFDDPDLNLAEIDFIWSPNSLSAKDYEKIVELEKKNPNHKIVVNHFENHTSLTTKSDMIKAMSNHYKKNTEACKIQENIITIYFRNTDAIIHANKQKHDLFLTNQTFFVGNLIFSYPIPMFIFKEKVGYNVFHSIPASYVLVVGVNTVDLRDFQIKFNEISKQNYKRCTLPEKHCSNNVWILKPENQSQGKGIEIFQSLKSIQSFLHYKPAFSKWVIQKYIERPLLYNGRKFDLRVWVLFTNKGELLVYKNGYLRTSSSKYSMSSFNDAIHLTNWSLQKGLQSYEKHEQGNRLPLKEGLQYIFDTQYSKYKVDYEKHIYPRMKDLIIDLVRSCEAEMFSSKKLKSCFELYGFDFIIDEDLRCWLIEANRNPGFGLPTEKAKKLIDDMVDEMLKITVDNIFPPRAALEPRSNIFDLIYTMKPSPLNRFQQKNDRRSFNINVYPIPELEPQTATGEKRYQVLNPLQEHEQNQINEKQKMLENEQIRQYKQNQRSLTYSSELHNLRTEEDSNKNDIQISQQDENLLKNEQQQNHINEVELDNYHDNFATQQQQRSKNNLDKPKSRGDQISRDLFDKIKQQSLDFDSYLSNQLSSPTTLSQPYLPQRVSSIILMSPRTLDPLSNPLNRLEQQKEFDNGRSNDVLFTQNQTPQLMQSSKIILDPITPQSIQSHLIAKKLNWPQDQNNNNFTTTTTKPLQSESIYNLSSTQNNFNQSQERKQFINRSYSRSLLKIKQLNEQAQQLKAQYQLTSLKPNLIKSQSTSNTQKWKQDQQPNIQSPIIQPRQNVGSYSVHQSSKNETKKVNLIDKELPSQNANIALPKENLYFQKTTSIYTNLRYQNKL